MSVAVIKHKGSNLKNEIGSLFKEIGFNPRGRVFVKPNLCARKIKNKSENTDPDFMEKLIEFLLDCQCEVLIGHTPLLGYEGQRYSFEKVLEVSKFDKFEGREKVKVLNLDDVPNKIIEKDGIKFSIPKIVEETDLYINLSKLKTHMQTTVSLSLKNQMGLVALDNRKEMHRKGLETFIAKLSTIIKPDISIIDGIIAMEGDGPHHGLDKKSDLLICGDDMVEVDSIACEMIGISPGSVDHIRTAQELGSGKIVAQEIVDRYEKHKVKFRQAKRYIQMGLRLKVWPSSGCPGCYLALEEAAKDMVKDPILLLRFLYRENVTGLNIVYGDCSNDEGSPGTLGFGQCSKKYCKGKGLKHLNGCPLSKNEVLEFFREYL